MRDDLDVFLYQLSEKKTSKKSDPCLNGRNDPINNIPKEEGVNPADTKMLIKTDFPPYAHTRESRI